MHLTKVLTTNAGALRDLIAPRVPEPALALLLSLLEQYPHELWVTKARSSKYGDYRHPHSNKGHVITINGNLNPYAFLITLLHEVAHLVTWQEYKNKVDAHGKEWKRIFSAILTRFNNPIIFPEELCLAVHKYSSNVKASSCSDINLMKALAKYDTPETEEGIHLEELAPDIHFRLSGNRIFVKGPKLRKRYQCKEVSTGRMYLVHPLAKVQEMPSMAKNGQFRLF